MESLEEILKVVGGLIFAVIYFFGGQIFKGQDDGEERPPTLPRQRGDSGDAEDDVAARQRQIQEAIRRKIMERRQQNQAPEPAAQEPVVQQRERHKEVAERQKEMRQQPPRLEPTPEAVEPDGRFSWEASDNVYEEQMQARLQQIEATKRRAKALKRQASDAGTPSKVRSRSKQSVHGSLLSGSVRSTLRDPGAARAAFVYGEVLGKPVGLRRSGSGVE